MRWTPTPAWPPPPPAGAGIEAVRRAGWDERGDGRRADRHPDKGGHAARERREVVPPTVAGPPETQRP